MLSRIDFHYSGYCLRMDFEDILHEVGDFGHWQKVIFFLICLPDIFLAMSGIVPVIVGATPKWSCLEFISENPEQNGTIWDSSVFLNNSGPICKINNTYRCSNISFMDDFTSIVSEWDLVCDKNYVSDLILTIQMVGTIMGAGIFAQLSGSIGRKKAYFIAVGVLIIPGIIAAFSPMWQMYAACRFFVGVGFGSYNVVNTVYPIEFVGRKWRSLSGTIGLWGIGVMLLALCGFGIRNWRYLLLVTSVPGLLYYICWFIIPESPRWLAVQGRYDDAEAVLAKIAKNNKRNLPDTAVLKAFVANNSQRESKLKQSSYADLFRHRLYRKRTFCIGIVWFAVYISFYTLTYNMRNLSGNRYLNVFYGGLFDQAGMLTVLFITNSIGRRYSQFLCSGVTLCCNIIIMAVFASGTKVMLADLTLAANLIGKSVAIMGIYIVGIWTAELFPTDLRNQASGVGSVLGRVGMMVAPQMVFLSTFYKLLPYIITSSVTIITLAVLFLLPETNNRPMEERHAPGTQGYDSETSTCSAILKEAEIDQQV